jgi:hypothetical protein
VAPSTKQEVPLATKWHPCGSGGVAVEEDCSFTCTCEKTGCNWYVTCNKKIVTKGTEKPRVRPKTTTVVVDGKRRDIAVALEEHWGRAVTVPRGTGQEHITRRTRGRPEHITKALGLELEP